MNNKRHASVALNGYPIAGFGLVTIGLAVVILAYPWANYDWILDPLNGLVAAVLAITIVRRIGLGLSRRADLTIWATGLALATLVSVNELAAPFFGDLWAALHVETASDLILWLAAPIGYSVAARFERMPRLVKALLTIGFILQSVSVFAEIGAGRFIRGASLGPALMETLVEFSQFVCLQAYLAGFSLILLYVTWAPVRIPDDDLTDLARCPHGSMARHLFHRFGLFHKPRYPSFQIFHLPGGMPLFDFGAIAYCVPKLGRRVKAKFGKSIGTQLCDILSLMMKHGLNAHNYYTFELYIDGKIDSAGGYLTRYETKNGLFRAFNRLLPKIDHRRSNLGDKLKFAELCRRNNIQAESILAIAEDGFFTWREGAGTRFTTGVFVKPRHGKGAKNVEAFRKAGIDSFTASDGRRLNGAALKAHIARRSSHGPLIAQEHLVNAPELADLADQSLIVMRVITCLDAAGNPIVTHAMLRVLCKLEPGWPIDDELGAPIDLDMGRLGQFASDKVDRALDFRDDHPVTGARIRGRILSNWDEVKKVALAAHGLCLDRLIIGWDIAVTPDGARLLEGNAYPDVAFLQHVHRAPLGAGPMGPLLKARLAQMARLLSD